MFLALFALGLSVKPRKPSISTRFSDKQPNGDPLCDLCNQIVSDVKDLVASAALEEEIKDFLDGYCDTLAWPTKDVCKGLVSSYLPSIIQMIEDNIDSLQICTTYGFCNETSKGTKKVTRIQQVKQDDSPVCLLCQQLVHIVDFLLSNETLEEEIKEIALDYCGQLAWPTSDVCKNAVNTYLPSFIKYVDDGIKPLDVCQNIDLCSVTAHPRARNIAIIKSDEGCQTCQKWFKWAEDKLDEVTVEGLWKLISEECPKVPYLQYFCQIINEQNIETFVSLILSTLPPDQCCQWIKVC